MVYIFWLHGQKKTEKKKQKKTKHPTTSEGTGHPEHLPLPVTGYSSPEEDHEVSPN